MFRRLQGLMMLLLVWGTITTMPVQGQVLQAPDSIAHWLYSIGVGVAAHDVDSGWSATPRERGTDFLFEAVLARPAVNLVGGTIRPQIGAAISIDGDTSRVYAGMSWEFMWDCGLLLNLGLAGAWHDGELDARARDRKSLGSRFLFRVPFAIGYDFNTHHRMVFTYAHISNAGLASPNEGMDTAGVLYVYRF